MTGPLAACLPPGTPLLCRGCGVGGEPGDSSAVRGRGPGSEVGLGGGREGRREAAVRERVSAISAAVGRARGSAATQASCTVGEAGASMLA